jgi:hypothetical protein
MAITGISSGAHDQSSNLKLRLLKLSLPESPSSIHKLEQKPPEKKNSATAELSKEALAEISLLKAQDLKVRQHEQAHLSASAGLAVSSASFTYQRGPNGINYAVAGEVKIDTSAGRTPEETLAKAEVIIDAALAPIDPSAADRSIAAHAQQMALQANLELLKQHAKQDGHSQGDRQSSVSTADGAEDAINKSINIYA